MDRMDLLVTRATGERTEEMEHQDLKGSRET
jgi:hypothetical protein